MQSLLQSPNVYNKPHGRLQLPGTASVKTKQYTRINDMQIKKLFCNRKKINIPRGLLGVGGSGMGIAAMKGRRIRNTMIYFVLIEEFGNQQR